MYWVKSIGSEVWKREGNIFDTCMPICVSERALGCKLGDLGLVPVLSGLQRSNRKNSNQMYGK